jgi:ATP-dependent Clp protease ATP-binding subunit ClpA
MPKINVYLPEQLAEAVKEAQVPVSAICQSALERAVRDVTSARSTDAPPTSEQPAVGLFTRFTNRARHVMVLAQDAARGVPHDYVGTEHLLLGILDEGGNLAIKVLTALEIESADLRAELIASMGRPTDAAHGNVPFTPLAKRALELTSTESLSLGHNYIGCEHLLLGLLATEDGLASQVLRRMGVELRTTRRAVTTALSGFVQAKAAASTPDPTMSEILQRLAAIERKLSA